MLEYHARPPTTSARRAKKKRPERHGERQGPSWCYALLIGPTGLSMLGYHDLTPRLSLLALRSAFRVHNPLDLVAAFEAGKYLPLASEIEVVRTASDQ